jgi:hypothetical protein
MTQAQGARQQWEYGRVAIALHPTDGKQQWIVVGAGGSITGPQNAAPHHLLDNFLQVLGTEGWELVGVIDTVTPARGPNLLFKRPHRPEA